MEQYTVEVSYWNGKEWDDDSYWLDDICSRMSAEQYFDGMSGKEIKELVTHCRQNDYKGFQIEIYDNNGNRTSEFWWEV